MANLLLRITFLSTFLAITSATTVLMPKKANIFGLIKPLDSTTHISLSKSTTTTTTQTALILRGGASASEIDSELASNAFEWCANLGAPAALIAGAVLATLSETRSDLIPRRSDKRTLRLSKKLCRFLLLTSFALEIVSIFSTTVTGTMLLSYADRKHHEQQQQLQQVGGTYGSAMGFLRQHHEFEYLTARVTFLQGLFHWLLAVALEVIIPKDDEGPAAKQMNVFISSSLLTIVLLMLSFYNNHMTFYRNYAHMLMVYIKVTFQRFFLQWPPRPMFYLFLPSIVLTIIQGSKAFGSPPDEDN